MSKKLNEIKEQIRNVPLQTDVMMLIISKICFGNMQKREIAEKVFEFHEECGGKETLPKTRDAALAGALAKLVKQGKATNPFLGVYNFKGETPDSSEGKSTVYVIYFPTDKTIAENQERELWKCKIGTTDRPVAERIEELGRGKPEKPVCDVEIKTNLPGDLESTLHKILKFRGRSVEGSSGNEWFETNPEEVEHIYHFLTSLT